MLGSINSSQMTHQIITDLTDTGYSYVEGLLTEEQCSLIMEKIELMRTSKLDKEPLNLNDSEDQCNVLYESKRSPMTYGYLKTNETDELSIQTMGKLKGLTSFSWDGNINSYCQPVFIYYQGQFIKEHRGRNVGYGNNDFVAVVMITKPQFNFKKGQFFLNKFGEASEDGKTIYNEDLSKRQYFDIQQGDALIFNNNLFIHGTTPVEKGESTITFRITTSWRTSN